MFSDYFASGYGKKLLFESIQKGREAQNLAALQAIEKGKEHYHEAHLAHRKLVQQEAQGKKSDVLTIKSCGRSLMSADIMSELAKEFQGLYEEIQAIKQTIQSTGS